MATIKIDDEIGYWGINARDFKEQLALCTGDVTIEINSPGGSVIEGIAIFNAIRDYKKGKVDIIITGVAASMASYIALSGDTIKAYDNAIYMIHNAMGGTRGDYRDFENYSKHLYSMSGILKRAYVAKTGKSEEEIQSLMDSETYYFGESMLEAGFIDEIISTENEKIEESAIMIAKENFVACMANVQKNSKDEENEQIAAIIRDIEKSTLRVNSASAKIENKQGVTSMNYTKEQFEALEVQHAEALNVGTASAVQLERERVASILALNGCGDIKSKAINDGISAGECAITLNKAVDTKIATARVDFEEAASKAVVSTEEVAISDDEQAWKDAEAKVYGGKK